MTVARNESKDGKDGSRGFAKTFGDIANRASQAAGRATTFLFGCGCDRGNSGAFRLINVRPTARRSVSLR